MTMHSPNSFPLRQVLAVSDLSAAATNSVWRAALVAREHGASLRILHVAASRSGAPPAQPALEALGRELHERLKIVVLAQQVAGSFRRELLAALREADLVVVRTSQSQPVRDWMRGTHPERWLHACRVPVLVVKRPTTARYRRILVDAHDAASAPASIAVAAAMARGPYREVLRALEADQDLAQAWRRTGDQPRGDRHHAAQRLRGLVRDLMEQGDASRIGDAPAIVFDGTAAALLAEGRRIFADLMVLARHAYRQPPLGLRRANTREILARAAADVLVLPGTADRASEPVQPGLSTA
jgi:nucleotide-binding universal stress UspA family protein